jgi:site-specific DNA-methyltransferase (adenine-specific)
MITIEPSLFSTSELQIGRILTPATDSSVAPALYYTHPNGELWRGDCVKWLSMLPDASVDMVFADPPYNIKKAEWDVFEDQEKYIAFSLGWIEQAARVLKRNGTLFICGFSEILADIKHPASRYFNSCRWIIWHYKNKANLGSDWGRSHESILHFRKSKDFTFNIDEIRISYNEHTLKYPSHPQAETSQYGKYRNGHLWTPNPLGAKPKDVLEIPQDLLDIPTTCNGMNEKTPHPTQKPEELLRKLIRATSNPGDFIIDPFCGSGTTSVCAQQLGRHWKACDLSTEYLSWAANRLEQVPSRPVEYWKNQDLENQKRRNSIR